MLEQDLQTMLASAQAQLGQLEAEKRRLQGIGAFEGAAEAEDAVRLITQMIKELRKLLEYVQGGQNVTAAEVSEIMQMFEDITRRVNSVINNLNNQKP